MTQWQRLDRLAMIAELMLLLGLGWWIAVSGYSHTGEVADLTGSARLLALWSFGVALCEGARARAEWVDDLAGIRKNSSLLVFSHHVAFATLAVSHAAYFALYGTVLPYRWELLVIDVMVMGVVVSSWQNHVCRVLEMRQE